MNEVCLTSMAGVDGRMGVMVVRLLQNEGCAPAKLNMRTGAQVRIQTRA